MHFACLLSDTDCGFPTTGCSGWLAFAGTIGLWDSINILVIIHVDAGSNFGLDNSYLVDFHSWTAFNNVKFSSECETKNVKHIGTVLQNTYVLTT